LSEKRKRREKQDEKIAAIAGGIGGTYDPVVCADCGGVGRRGFSGVGDAGL